METPSPEEVNIPETEQPESPKVKRTVENYKSDHIDLPDLTKDPKEIQQQTVGAKISIF